MRESQIISVPIASIDPNPLRRLGDYPFVERKLEALQRSIKEVGFWEGVIARKNGNRYQIAFGHRRAEAARRNKLDAISVIVRDLTDEQMLQFMGRENLEDYNAVFLIQLESWEAAANSKFFPDRAGKILGATLKPAPQADRKLLLLARRRSV